MPSILIDLGHLAEVCLLGFSTIQLSTLKSNLFSASHTTSMYINSVYPQRLSQDLPPSRYFPLKLTNFVDY